MATGDPAPRAAAPDLSDALEDCLREIYKLQAEAGQATNSGLAERLGTGPSSATAMMKRLAALGLVEHAPYRGATLTEAGRVAALGLVRRHRLLERFLADTLGVDLDVVHAEADRLEHGLSPELQERIAHVLGHPAHDPHGDPIPGPDAHLEPAEPPGGRTIASLAPGERGRVRRIPDGDPALVRYLAELGLLPGTELEVVGRAPFEGPITLRVGGAEHAIGPDLAGRLAVD